MSSKHQEPIACSQCGTEQPFTIWDSINVTVDPGLKAPLLSGDLTTFRCNECGFEARVASDCLYHDMDRELAVWLKYPDEEEPLEIEAVARELFSTLVPGRTCRLVSSLNELYDKICLADDGYSDHSIELFKLIVCIRDRIDLSIPMHYSATESSWFRGTSLVFAVELEEGFVERRYPKSQLDSATKLIPRLNPIIGSPSDKWPRVDRMFMLRVLQAAGLMREIK